MPVGEEPQLVAGRRALDAGRWAEARDAFRAALEDGEHAEALAGCGEALWWLGDTGEAMALRERAYARFRREGDLEAAVDVALWLCKNHGATFGNDAAARGWLARARRLVDDHALGAWHGWTRLMEAHHAADGTDAERLAREAYDQATAVADPDLELCALGAIGGALVQQGRVAEGVSYLDESMAGALGGEGRHRDTVVFTSCTTIISCTTCAEFERAVQWIRATDRFTERYGCPFLYAQCRIVYGEVLVAIGDWERAEQELSVAFEMSGDALPALRSQAVAALAGLRLDQGRVEEAERRVAGLDDDPAAVTTVARLHLARGRASTAEALVRRWVDRSQDVTLEQLLHVELLGRAVLAQDRPGEAAEHGRALLERGSALGCRIAVAQGTRLQGEALAAQGDAAGARTSLDTALAAFAQLGMPLEVARTRTVLAQLHRWALPDVAADEARAALAAFEALGARADADATARFLRDLGVPTSRPGPRSSEALTPREREVLDLLGEGLSNPDIAERLYISRRTAEQHVARILRKLGLRSRAEAAVEATLQRTNGSADVT